ncbi:MULTISPECIES: 4'-phosphopantetheinyl transferase superfamily protein [unclassified Crossiella]|uniref:4'-phosphopantetheinyl transferase family protein n=1 Tax=unclassified Crossiella TaxID=2620835 RepID=UPI001FFEC66E|nr:MULTISPECIES: 4'-phosphopantetheinyl transferase superfamily protein [unclassified Crossiella]MCK2241247.1 4'-phosphopantetheinyl transferase superfamily protein [Crossiella sp. S99.2]MCK2253609.1 4'-phosphopantetheinyl transferase superfamily protein [Crossiella sp. S99.1]
MLEKILPPGIAVAEAFGDPPEAVLFPEEEALLGRSVEKRRREFTTVRHCARRALAELGRPAVPLLRGERGAPIWPAGIVGSMTHCDGYRAAAVAEDRAVQTIGIDAEPHAPLPEGVLDAVSLPAERDWLSALSRREPGVHWDRLLFSAKESVYKAWFPLARRWLGFEEARLTVDPSAGSFRADLLVPGPVEGFSGRWLVADGLVVTTIAVRRSGGQNL